jgi:hypothetical protein
MYKESPEIVAPEMAPLGKIDDSMICDVTGVFKGRSFMKRCTLDPEYSGRGWTTAQGRRPSRQTTKKTSVGRPIAVVVNLIRPNRGLAVVLLGKSTTTKKMGSRPGDFRAP